jgi:simple sugar transport system ATP-binding protein
MSSNGDALLKVSNISKFFGSVIAIKDVSMHCRAGEVTCLLGDNGAGKSTLIKTLSGVYKPDEGEYLFDGESRHFDSPRDALDLGIATVYQDLAMIPLLSIWRNFFLGSEPTKGWGPWRRYDVGTAKEITRAELGKMGIDIRDPEQPVGTLSGGERQSVAIARAVYFGARVLILDEPTAALGVKQAGVVLRYILQAKQRGIGVIFITHNPHHAYPVGDHFVILRRGQVFGDFAKENLGLEQLVQMMAGGEELQNLAHELERAAGKDEAGDELARAAEALEAEAMAAELPSVDVVETPAVSEAEMGSADAAAAEAEVAGTDDDDGTDTTRPGPTDTRPGG